LLAFVESVSCIGVIEKPDQKGNRTWDMNEGIDTIDPGHHKLVLHKESLGV
jgi:hypothetical protein